MSLPPTQNYRTCKIIACCYLTASTLWSLYYSKLQLVTLSKDDRGGKKLQESPDSKTVNPISPDGLWRPFGFCILFTVLFKSCANTKWISVIFWCTKSLADVPPNSVLPSLNSSGCGSWAPPGANFWTQKIAFMAPSQNGEVSHGSISVLERYHTCFSFHFPSLETCGHFFLKAISARFL